MARASLGTPCPAPYGSSNLPIPIPGRRTSAASFGGTQDDTSEIEYTRAISIGLQNTKARRKPSFQRREKKEAAVTIFEDLLEDEELVVEGQRGASASTLLGKPAQRIPSHAARSKHEALPEPPRAAQAWRRSSNAWESAAVENERDQTCNLKLQLNGHSAPDKVNGGLQKEPRRRTIFVPTDDTTVLTIHPGANTTERLNDTFQLPHYVPQREYRDEKNAAKASPTFEPRRRPRNSLAVAPKRIPLQHIAAQEVNTAGMDIAGQNGGKENVPPAAEVHISDQKVSQVFKAKPARHSLAASKLLQPTAASQARQTIFIRHAVPLQHAPRIVSKVSPGQPQKSGPGAASLSNRHARPSPPRSQQTEPDGRISMQVKSREADRASAAQRTGLLERRMEVKTSRLQQYPVLTEDIAQPELYEDSWLSHQEVALTELVNQIFTSGESRPSAWHVRGTTVREHLINIYHQPQVTTLHRRLQASLLYGALGRPRDMSGPPPNPAQDIGLRKRFIGLWLDSYDPSILRSAAEVVFGRQLPKNYESGSKNISPTNGTTLDPHQSRRALIGFLETFLVEVDDAEEPDEERGDDSNTRWRKMVLRSLMLIWLLDRAKGDGMIMQGCLFKASSPRKSSVLMLHALAAMFIPSIGDVTRVLRHLDYQVQHAQNPLDEVKYRIDNIASDLRDGIQLTRLVEILLFSPDRMRRAAESPEDVTVAIQMPDLTILESVIYDGYQHEERARILSQHLKMPCLGRAQKTYNVQIAISALHDHGKIGEGAMDVTADDIVNGHRERTLSLLWSLASNYGLEQLVDFKALAADIKRSGGVGMDVSTAVEENDRLSDVQQESLLKKWAAVYAAQQGIRLGNLTTSFADGKAYAAILNAFTDRIRPCKAVQGGASANNGLEAQLRAFGCSKAFIKQISCTSGTIPSRKTTISNLAFLASRLLPLMRQHNAAVTIQRAFRLRRSRTIASNRVALMRVANACAQVVQTQNRLVSAAVVLQRAWRGVVDARIQKLGFDVELFQVMAKGWLERRSMKASMSSSFVGSHSLRVMGGW